MPLASFFPKVALAVLELLCFPVRFRVISSVSVENAPGVDGYSVEAVNSFGEYMHFNKIKFSSP